MSINIQQNIPLSRLTTFNIGGPAKFFCEIGSEKELIEALKYAKENKLEFFVMGGGSNVIFSDDGFSGIVIKIGRKEQRIIIADNESIECWAGESLANLVKFCTENSLTGLEWAIGIPGAVGGAIRGNVGAYSGSMANSVESVNFIENSDSEFKIESYKLQDCKFGYRNSIFKENKNLIVISVVLKFKKGNKEEIENKVKEIIKKRGERIPKEQSAGSFFENPKVENQELIARFERDSEVKCRDGKIPAGWLIDEVDLRGKKIGQVMVSEKHANFLVNLGNAKAQDVVMLASLIKMKVRNELGVQLKEEVQYVGF